MPPFFDRLAAAVVARQTPLVVGLDPRWDSLPHSLKDLGSDPEARVRATREFCLGLVDVVAPLVPAIKPQVAFFEQLGWRGMQVLAEVIAAARERELLVVLDGKRNDIGSTAEGYADGWLGASSPWQADALTVSPYLGEDSLEPFERVAKERDCGLFVLVKTSNPGSGTLQDRVADGQTVYRRVADLVEQHASATQGERGYGVTGAVVGATYPEQLAELRQAMPHVWLLVPGYGSQGGTAADVAAAYDARGLGAIVNSSRAIIFAHARPEYRDRFAPGEWQRAVEEATRAANADLTSAMPSITG